MVPVCILDRRCHSVYFDFEQKRQVQMCKEAETREADLSVSSQIRGGM